MIDTFVEMLKTDQNESENINFENGVNIQIELRRFDLALCQNDEFSLILIDIFVEMLKTDQNESENINFENGVNIRI